MTDTITLIKARLSTELSPQQLEIIDESHLHAGHAGTQSGKGHYVVNISATTLNDLPRIKKHQKIYQALGDLMDTHIHALSLNIK